MPEYIPAYIRAMQQGRLKDKIREAYAVLDECMLCPRQCRVNRADNEKGFCSTGRLAYVSSWAPHFGEEPPLSGINGSGTIFFSHCNLKCIFCQNYDISINGEGHPAEEWQIASIMLELQKMGCHNINLVTPSHVVPQILNALFIAADSGLNIPLVYNCSGYESRRALRILDGVVDIYMPDFKFWSSEMAKLCCNAADYPKAACKAVRIMHDQVGDLVTDDSGIAVSGLLVRHLVMPGQLDDTFEILNFLKKSVSPGTHVNVMSQYRPVADAYKVKEIAVPLSPSEYRKAVEKAKELNLNIVR